MIINKTSLILALGLMLASARSEAESYPKWLAIGNSITQHGPKADIQWDGEPRGMAASRVETDYVHLLQKLIQQRDPASAVELKIVGRLGKLSGGTMEQMVTVIGELSAWDADLVTIQLGENDRLNEIGPEGFETRYRTLVDGLLSNGKHPKILCTGLWAPGNPLSPNGQYQAESEIGIKEQIIEKICKEKGLTYICITKYAMNPNNHGDGNTPGVKWHPNDAGMQGYAEAIFSALYSSTK